jgi:hypothetical protein
MERIKKERNKERNGNEESLEGGESTNKIYITNMGKEKQGL